MSLDHPLRFEEEWLVVERIVLVKDNLNTHRPASLHETFEPAEARRIAERFEWHYTPKHGSWLNIAECELSALARQCLGQRIPNRDKLKEQASAWEIPRNQAVTTVKWCFSTEDARMKLAHLYPQVS